MNVGRILGPADPAVVRGSSGGACHRSGILSKGATRMTIDDLAKAGEECLIEYEARLRNITGIKDYNASAEKIQEPLDRALADIQAEEIKPVIRKVLQKLAAAGDRCMSEPKFTEPQQSMETKTVKYKDLRLTFHVGRHLPGVHVNCWTLDPKNLF
jgi:hypothetical protein